MNENHTGNAKENSLMDGLPPGADVLQRALGLQRRAALAGFDWAAPEAVLDKLQEEAAELQAAMAGGDAKEVEDELGDLLFVITNLARQLDIDPAAALRRANAKFEQRFRALEQLAGSGPALQRLTLGEMEDLWRQVKATGLAR